MSDEEDLIDPVQARYNWFMSDESESPENIAALKPEDEEMIRTNPLLNIDTFIIPSPYIKDPGARKDTEHSYLWRREGEILGYMLTYSSADADEYLVYKLVTSPYGRGLGIGTAFIKNLAADVPAKSLIYLYVWEKQHDTLDFFRNRGFDLEDSIVYRNMVYHRLSALRETVLDRLKSDRKRAPAADEIGRTRHDARKTLSSLTAMVNALAPENAGRIIEDINRETTTLVNMLNMYRDSLAMAHEVNLQELILDRLIPYVNTGAQKVELAISLSAAKPMVLGHWLNIGRALVNLASNAMDAMEEGDDTGRMSIALEDEDDRHVLLRLGDNGAGIPPELLVRDSEGVPAFVGKSTKEKGRGEGLGTAQVWTTFGSERLDVASRVGEGTEWTIRFERSSAGLSKNFARLQRRFHELQGLSEEIVINSSTPRNKVETAIWRLRSKEIYLFELLERFSQEHNIRDLYRAVLSYFQGVMGGDELESTVSGWKGEHPALNTWLAATARRIRRRRDELASHVDLEAYRDVLFKSYGQSVDKVIIFTLNPKSGEFLATDRKLAEHLDFVPYLGGARAEMLRGEFVGNADIESNPIYLGVWSVDSDEDLAMKLALLQEGARAMIDMGFSVDKRLAFYQSTYVRHRRDIDSDASCSFGEFAACSAEQLKTRFVRDAEDEMQGFLAALD